MAKRSKVCVSLNGGAERPVKSLDHALEYVERMESQGHVCTITLDGVVLSRPSRGPCSPEDRAV